jgi:lysozyme family protein
MHEELENFERNQVWELVDRVVRLSGQNGFGKIKRVRMEKW